MANKGLWVISYQGTQKVGAGNKPLNTTEPLIVHIVCCGYVPFILGHQFLLLSSIKNRGILYSPNPHIQVQFL